MKKIIGVLSFALAIGSSQLSFADDELTHPNGQAVADGAESSANPELIDKINQFGFRYFDIISEQAGNNENSMSSGVVMARLLLVAAKSSSVPKMKEAVGAILGKSPDTVTKNEILNVYAELAQLLQDMSLNEGEGEDKKTVKFNAGVFLKGKYADATDEQLLELAKFFDIEKADNNTDPVHVNKWISDSTEGLIDGILREGQQVDSVLASTMYFKLPWQQKFPKSETKPRKFTKADGSEINALTMAGKFKNVSVYSGDDYQVSVLPFQGANDGKQYFADIYTAASGKDLDVVREDLKNGKWKDNLKNANQVREVDYFLPKTDLKIETKDPEGALAKMGLKDLQLHEKPVDQVIEKSRIIVSEESMEGAVVNAFVGRGFNANGPMTVKIDEPYIIVVRDKDGRVLSMTQVNNPGEAAATAE